MPISQFKAIASTLRRFADVRETAKEPRDRIIVQVAKGSLKFIAGDDYSTVVADAAPCEGKGRVVVSARMLLTAADALRGRGNVTVDVEKGVVTLRLDAGGKVDLKAITAVTPGFVRPPKKNEAVARVEHSGFAVASKVFPAVTSKHHPADKVYLVGGSDNLTMTGCDERSFAVWYLVPEVTVSRRAIGAVPAGLFPSMLDLKEPGVMAWSEKGLAIRSGRFLVGATLAPEALPWPTPQAGEGVRVSVDRKGLISALAGSMDGLKRSRLKTENSALVVESWDGAGAMTLPAHIEGRGRIGVDADRMKRLLTALPGKKVTIEFGGGTARPLRLSAEEDSDWQTLLAPVV